MECPSFLPVASGSKGNCSLITTEHSRVLVDCGIGVRRLIATLDEHGVAPESIDAVFITHTHSDHVSGLANFLKRGSPRIYCHEEAAGAVMHVAMRANGALLAEPEIVTFRSGEGFHHRDMDVLPVEVPHDCDPTVMFKFYTMDSVIGILTDLGEYNDELTHIYSDCDLLLLESNHCEEMLRGGSYPESLKRRIRGSGGHLSNEQAARFATGLSHMPRNLILGHLSENNNTAGAASSAFSRIETGHIPHTVVEQGATGPLFAL